MSIGINIKNKWKKYCIKYLNNVMHKKKNKIMEEYRKKGRKTVNKKV